MTGARAAGGLRIAVSAGHDLIAAAVLKLLYERDVAVADVIALSDEADPDLERSGPLWGDSTIELVDTATADLAGVDLLFLCPPCAHPLALLERAVESGARVIDLIGVARDGGEAAIVAPDLPAFPGSVVDLKPDPEARVYRCPDPLALILATVLAPLAVECGLSSLRVQWLLPASSLGEPGIRELAGQAENLFNQRDLPTALYGRQIAFNLLAGAPAPADSLQSSAHDLEQLLGDHDIPVDQRAVWVPVFFGVSATLWIETRQAVTQERLTALLREAPGLLLAEPGTPETPFPSPVEHALESDAVHLGLLGPDLAAVHGQVLWLVADDVRRGRALAAVRIAERLVEVLADPGAAA